MYIYIFYILYIYREREYIYIYIYVYITVTNLNPGFPGLCQESMDPAGRLQAREVRREAVHEVPHFVHHGLGRLVLERWV